MGTSQAERAKTHARIVRIASARLREAGLEGVSVADLMREAGLTVGGFYKHFGCREELVVEALEAAFGDWRSRRDQSKAGEGCFGRATLVGEYLSERHRDRPGAGCAIAALAADAARAGEGPRAVFSDKIRGAIAILAEMTEGDAPAARADAILTLSSLVGALQLARAVTDEALSAEILSSVRAGLS